MLSSSSIAYLSASLGEKGLFSSANILLIADVVPQVVLLMLLLSRNEWNVPPFCTHYQKQPNLVPRSSRLTVQYSGNYAVKLTSFFKHRILLPNLVNCSWWWWIIRVIVANQIRRNILNKNALKSLDCWEIR